VLSVIIALGRLVLIPFRSCLQRKRPEQCCVWVEVIVMSKTVKTRRIVLFLELPFGRNVRAGWHSITNRPVFFNSCLEQLSRSVLEHNIFNGDITQDSVERRLSCRAIFNAYFTNNFLLNLLTNRDISLIRKGRLYSSFVWSSMLHRSETWPVRKENEADFSRQHWEWSDRCVTLR